MRRSSISQIFRRRIDYRRRRVGDWRDQHKQTNAIANARRCALADNPMLAVNHWASVRAAFRRRQIR
jgi:hypothetical protein